MNPLYRRFAVLLAAASLLFVGSACAQDDKTAAKSATTEKATEKPAEATLPADSTTQGAIDVGGQHIAYTAIAGTITVGSTDSQDAQLGPDGKPQPGSQLAAGRARQSEGCAAGGADVLRGVLQDGRQGRGPADYVFLQRRTGQLHGVAAHGIAGTEARGRRQATRTCLPRPTSWWTTPTACST